jgi:hypothetical protein
MWKSTVIPTLLAAVQFVSAEIDFEERCDEDYFFCLSSFIWCDSRNAPPECSYPENTYQESVSGGSAIAAVLFTRTYELSWIKTDDAFPVEVTWRIGAPNGQDDIESLTWSKSEYTL